MRAEKADSTAILVDLQERILPAMYNGEAVLKQAVKLTKGFGILGVPVAANRQYPKGLGDLAEPVREALGEYEPYDKVCFSVYGNRQLIERIEQSGRRTVFIYGIEAHVCVLQSVIDFIQAGYRVYLVCDCITSRTELDYRIALERAAKEGAYLTTCEAVLFELLKEAGSAEFKQISALIK